MRFNQKWTASRYEEGKSFTPFPATVPGNVQCDYAKAFDFGDFQFADQVKKFDELEDYRWVYSTSIEYACNPGEEIWFVAEGIDYSYDILLDGKKLFSGEGMFTPVELNITDLARQNALLQVLIHPHPKREGAPVDRSQASQSCKPPFSYGWDWNPRLLVSGLWRDAYIETRDSGFIAKCEPFYELNDALDTATVHFETACQKDVKYTLYNEAGAVVYEGNCPDFELKNVNLWWCNGQGTPYLYRWTAESATHKRSGTIGFRKVRLIHNEGADEEVDTFPKSCYVVPITLELNGRRIFAQGSNWVNPELFPGTVTEERYESLLQAAKEANMNILRIWGGSGINKPAFYEICDRLGIMVWQEFMLACNNYIGTKKYLRVLEQEALSIIRDLRKHPSIVLWCGGNELFNDWSGMDVQSHALRLLNKLCYEEDFSKPFLATSPLFGMGHGGYFFKDVFNGRDVFEIFSSSNNTAYTEFGVPAMASTDLLAKIIPEKELFPIEKTDAWITHHGFDAWYGDSWIFADTLKYYFGEPDSLETMVANSQKLQYIGYKAIFEEARRQWPHCSMAINWCYEEPWITAANNAVISYPDIKKPGYYGIQEALRPVIASARIPHFDWKAGEKFTAELWLLNTSPDTVSETVTAEISIGSTVYAELSWNTGDVQANTNQMGPQVNLVLPDVEDCNEIILNLYTNCEDRNSHYQLKYTPKTQKVKQLNI